MSSPNCPDDLTIARFVDDDLAPEPHDQVARHLQTCRRCESHAEELRAVGEALSGPDVAAVDLDRHVRDVMARVQKPAAHGARRRTSLVLAGAAALAACLVVAIALPKAPPAGAPRDELAARGGGASASLARDVGVQVYALTPQPWALQPGAEISARTPLTAGVRNLGGAPAHVLIFLVDAREQVHWIAPAYTDPTTDPEGVRAIERGGEEVLLPTTVVFDDLAAGPARLVTLVSHHPRRVSAIEGLTAEQRKSGALAQALNDAEVREIALQIAPHRPERTP